MVGVAQRIVVILMMVAGLLAAFSASLPEGVSTTVPPVCVQVPALGDGMQAGICP
jgi:hypothetical protein